MTAFRETAVVAFMAVAATFSAPASAQSKKAQDLTPKELMEYSVSKNELAVFDACTRDGHRFYMELGAGAPIRALQRPGGVPTDQFIDGLRKVFTETVARYDYSQFHTGEKDPAAYLAVEGNMGQYVDSFADRHGVLMLWRPTRIVWSETPAPQCQKATPLRV